MRATSSSTRGPGTLVSALAIALMCLIWGSTWLVIRTGLESLPPFGAAALRFAISSATFALLVPWLGRYEGGRRPPLGLSLINGTLIFGLSYAIVYWTEARLPSGPVSVLWASNPLMVALFGRAIVPGERLGASQWVGFVLAFCGVASLFVTDLADLGPDAIPAGLLLLVSPLVSAFGSTVIKRHGSDVSSLRLNRDGMAIGALCLGLAALTFERDAPYRFDAKAWASLLYLSLAGTVVTFGLYFWMLRSVSVTRLSLIAYVIPAIALIFGATLGDEPVGVSTWTGLGVLLAGVWLGSRRARGAAGEGPRDRDSGLGPAAPALLAERGGAS